LSFDYFHHQMKKHPMMQRDRWIDFLLQRRVCLSDALGSSSEKMNIIIYHSQYLKKSRKILTIRCITIYVYYHILSLQYGITRRRIAHNFQIVTFQTILPNEIKILFFCIFLLNLKLNLNILLKLSEEVTKTIPKRACKRTFSESYLALQSILRVYFFSTLSNLSHRRDLTRPLGDCARRISSFLGDFVGSGENDIKSKTKE